MALSIERQLPEELLDHIISYTTLGAATRLCRVSKQFKRLTTPRIYSTIVLGHGEPSDNKPSQISFLAHLLLTSPAHAELVQSVICDSNWGCIDKENKEACEPRPWPGIGTPELQTMLRSKITRFQLPEKEEEQVYEKIKTGTNEDAIVALLILSLPDLQQLHMNFGFCETHDDFISTFELLADHLKLVDGNTSPPVDVLVTGEDEKYPNLPIHVAALLHMPNIRSLYGLNMGDDEGEPDPDSNPFARLKPRSCAVEYIELRTSKLYVDNFNWMMNAVIPGRFKTLNYEIGNTWAWCGIFHPAIMASLRPHHETLENLGLSHEAAYPHRFGPDSGDEPYPCDFKPFEALKRLRVAPVYVWGHNGFNDPTDLVACTTKEVLWQALPSNLEQLWICRAESQNPPTDTTAPRFEPDCLLPALHLLLDHKEDFLRLNEIRLEFTPIDWPKDDNFEALESFCRRSESMAVKVTIILAVLPDRDGTEINWGWDEDVEWTGCLHNHGPQKMWIDGAEEDDLAGKIKEIRDRMMHLGMPPIPSQFVAPPEPLRVIDLVQAHIHAIVRRVLSVLQVVRFEIWNNL